MENPMPQPEPLVLDSATTALVLVDLQNLMVALPTVPHSGKDVLAQARRLVEHCHAKGILVVLVRVSVGVGGAMQLRPPLDAPFPPFPVPERWDEFPTDIAPQAGDVAVTKYNWGAFYATDLDQQLRRRGIRTLLIGGIATNFGVESTARQAHEAGYATVLIEDAMGAFEESEHRFAIERIFPRLGRVRSTE